MKVGRAQPQAVERRVGVSVGLGEMSEVIGRAREYRRDLPVAEDLRIGIEPIRVRAERRDRLDLAELGAFKDVALPCLASRDTPRRPACRPPCREEPPPGPVDRDWAAASGPSARPRPARSTHIDRFDRHARANRRRKIALFEKVVVAVPMELHGFPRTLIEDRWKVGGADQFLIGDAAPGRELEQQLIGVERVDAAGSPRRLALKQRQQARSVFDKSFADARKDGVAPSDQVEPSKRAPCRFIAGRSASGEIRSSAAISNMKRMKR